MKPLVGTPIGKTELLIVLEDDVMKQKKHQETRNYMWEEFAKMFELTFRKKARRTCRPEIILYDWYVKGYIAGCTRDLE